MQPAPEEDEDQSKMEPVQGETDPASSRATLLETLAELEAGIRQGEAMRQDIGRAASSMRDQAHRQVEQLEDGGIGTPEEQNAFQRALTDRRTCDVVAAMTREE